MVLLFWFLSFCYSFWVVLVLLLVVLKEGFIEERFGFGVVFVKVLFCLCTVS